MILEVHANTIWREREIKYITVSEENIYMAFFVEDSIDY